MRIGVLVAACGRYSLLRWPWVALGYGGKVADDYSQHEGNLSVRIAW
jgi:hypothetical protein